MLKIRSLLFIAMVAGFCSLFAGDVAAQRKAVSNKEVTGTFKTPDGANYVKIFPVGRGGLDRPGYNLQVELFASLKLGPDGDARGNTGMLSGYAPIEGDTATFTPDGMEYDKCTVTLKFVRVGVLKITQKGDCGFINDMITLDGTYRKTSSVKPKFLED